VAAIVGDAGKAEVFVLALDGLLVDEPSPPALAARIKILAECFVHPRRRI
jgi:hypothetical protein